jgi:pSer/pThr/pTyr-binding forkhead associated (FHA) protein
MPDSLPGSVAAAAAEMLAINEAERAGAPFLVYRAADGGQRLVELGDDAARLTVGRRAECDLALTWDSEVSRLHAVLERIGDDWVVIDDGLSRNGSYANGERVIGRRRLSDGDRLCFGETVVRYRNPRQGESKATDALPHGAASVPLSPMQRKVLIALSRPVNESAFAPPATNREIADEVYLSVDAVKAHLRVLFERFGLEDLPQNQKRARLAATALVNGLVTQRDF